MQEVVPPQSMLAQHSLAQSQSKYNVQHHPTIQLEHIQSVQSNPDQLHPQVLEKLVAQLLFQQNTQMQSPTVHSNPPLVAEQQQSWPPHFNQNPMMVICAAHE